MLPAWQSKLIDEIVASMKKNFINFNKEGKTEADWKSSLTYEFKNYFATLATEQDVVDAYKEKFHRAPTPYLIPSYEKITQDFITKNIRDSNAILLHGEEEMRFIYCVVDGQLSTGNLFHENSLSSIKVHESLASQQGQIDPALPETAKLIEDSISRAAHTQFAEEVTHILAKLSQDEHMSLGYYPEDIETRRADPLFTTHKRFSQNTPLGMIVSEDILDRLKQTGPDFGFSTQPPAGKDLPENVGYLKIGEVFNLPDPKMADARNHVFHVMEQFQDKEAIILDLRDCGGGTPNGVEYLAGFFFDKPQHLTTYFTKGEDDEIQTSKLVTKPLLKADMMPLDLSKKPLYILINQRTFSAAEELAYDLQQLKGATLVGTQTLGGNHFTRGEPLLNQDETDCDPRFVLLIPCSYSINPASGTNWEDGPISEGNSPGVRPNIGIEGDQDALEVALGIENVRAKATSIHAEAVDVDVTPEPTQLSSEPNLEKSGGSISDSTARMLRAMPAIPKLVVKKRDEAERKPVSYTHDSIETEPHISTEADDAEAESHKRLTPFSTTPKPTSEF